MRMWNALGAMIAAQRGHLFPWVPVCLACGIGGYFALRWEPGPSHYLIAAILALVPGVLAGRAGVALGPVLWLCALIPAGGVLAGARAHWVAAPVLEFRYYGPVEGRIVGIDRSKMRLYDCEQTAQEDILDSGQEEEYNYEEQKPKKSFDGFKF